MFRASCLALILAVAAAFVPAPVLPTQGVRTSGSVMSMAYVPDGLTPAQWEAQKKSTASKAAANKKKFPKGNMGTDVKLWLQKLENKKDGTSGHTFAKMKYNPNDTAASKPRASNGIFGRKK